MQIIPIIIGMLLLTVLHHLELNITPRTVAVTVGPIMCVCDNLLEYWSGFV